MSQDIILASGSSIRAQLLRNAGVTFDIQKPRVDESTILESLKQEEATPRDIADTLGEIKARKVSEKFPNALAIGCDQVLAYDGGILQKPTSIENARDQLLELRGKRHFLMSAAVICEHGQPIWRHVSVVRLYMRDFSDEYLTEYLERNWGEIQHCVGCYQLESEGLRLFSRVEGDYFAVLGLPMLELLNFLALRGLIPS